MEQMFYIIAKIPFITILSLYLFNAYNIIWRFFSLYEAIKILKALLLSYAFIIIYYVLFNDHIPKSVIILSFILSMVGLTYFRLLKRIFLKPNKINAKNTLIIGASDYINIIIKNNNYQIEAIIDDDINIKNHTISGIKVHLLSDIDSIIEKYKIEVIILTKEMDSSIINTIFATSSIHKCEIKKINIETKSAHIQDISIEDLLQREVQDINKEQIKAFIENKDILITGAGGSIGSEIVRNCILYKAKSIILIDMNEFNLYSINEEIKKLNYKNTTSLLCSINSSDIDKVFANQNIDLVIHAAAYKHVNLVENNINSAIINNILGTKNIIDKAIKAKVSNIVLISTDKAIRPTSIMGATKRVCELYARSVDAKSSIIVSVRFGNVIGSSGSVIPKFKKQIENDENLSVTDKNVTRYFMLIKEACELVLQAGSIGKGKEIFILDMGESVKISDIAQKMIDISGKNLSIDYIGLQKGEKLYEELLFNENDEKTEFNSIVIAKEKEHNLEKINQAIDGLLLEDNQEKQKQKLWEIINNE